MQIRSVCNCKIRESDWFSGDRVLFKGPGKRGHIALDTLLPMMFFGLRKLGNICCGHKMFLNKIRNIFCVPDTKCVSATNVARAGKPGNICVGNNVSSFTRALTIGRRVRCFYRLLVVECSVSPSLLFQRVDTESETSDNIVPAERTNQSFE